MNKILVVDKWTNYCTYEGDHFGVVDGYIFIRNEEGDAIAVIAPGIWCAVSYKEDEAEE